MSVPVTALNFTWQADAKSCATFLRVFEKRWNAAIKDITYEAGRLVVTYNEESESLTAIDAAAYGFFNGELSL